MGSRKNKNISKRVAMSSDVGSEAAASDPTSASFSVNVKSILLIAAILLLTVTVYSSSLGNGFVNWDDGENVYENIYIKELSVANLKIYFTKALIGMYTPLVYLSYALDYKIGGLDPFIYHVTNLLLHLVNICLVFFVVRLLTRKLEVAAIAALLFAIHPMNTGNVAPVSTRGGLLYSLFFLASFFCYIRYLKLYFSLKYLILSFVFFILSLLSKSAAVVLPFALLLADYYCQRKFDFRAIAEKVPFVILSVVFGILTLIFRDDAGHLGSQYLFSAFERIFLVSYAILFYMVKLVLPVKLSAYHPYPEKSGGVLPLMFYLSPFFIAGMAYLFYRLRQYRRELLFGVLFFFVNIMLVLKVVPMGGEIVCDRYVYLPYIGVFMFIGCMYDRVSARSSFSLRAAIIAALVIVSTIFSIGSYDRNRVWANSYILFSDVIEKYPWVSLAYNNRGNYQKDQKNFGAAIADYSRAIEIDPNYALAFNNRGTARIAVKDYYGALADYNTAVELRPDFALGFYNRGNIKKAQGDLAGAVVDYDKAIMLKNDYYDAYINRGNTKKAMKDFNGALADYNRVMVLNPAYSPAYFNRALLKMENRDFEGALSDYNSLLEIDPRNAMAYYERGNIKIAMKDYNGAIAEYSRAIAIKPDYEYAYQNRGSLRMMMKNYSEAVADYSEVLKLSPINGGIYFSRGWGRFYSGDNRGACSDWKRAAEYGVKDAAAIMRQNCR